MDMSFKGFLDISFDYEPDEENNTVLWLREVNMDVSGGTLTVEDIDRVKNYPDIDTVAI